MGYLLLYDFRHDARHIVLDHLCELWATGVPDFKLAIPVFDCNTRVRTMHGASESLQLGSNCLFDFRHTYFVKKILNAKIGESPGATSDITDQNGR